MYSILKLTTDTNKKNVYFEILFKNTLGLRFYLFAVLTATLHSTIFSALFSQEDCTETNHWQSYTISCLVYENVHFGFKTEWRQSNHFISFYK